MERVSSASASCTKKSAACCWAMAMAAIGLSP